MSKCRPGNLSLSFVVVLVLWEILWLESPHQRLNSVSLSRSGEDWPEVINCPYFLRSYWV
jgi:hypothetical protein